MKTLKGSSRLRKLMREKKKKIFSLFLTLGFTSLTHTEKTIRLAAQNGVDLIELGFPFSDPLADGPVIQHSSQKALESGVLFQDALRLVKRIRERGIQIPILLFSYYNPVFHRGEAKTAEDLKRSGIDGLLIPDLPPEEGENLHRQLKRQGISLIYFLSPTSDANRVRLVAKKTDEFIYYVSSRGVTGVRKKLDMDLKRQLALIRRHTQKPVLIGFGISDARKVREASRVANGVIVGTALVKKMEKDTASARGLKKTLHFIRGLKQGLEF